MMPANDIGSSRTRWLLATLAVLALARDVASRLPTGYVWGIDQAQAVDPLVSVVVRAVAVFVLFLAIFWKPPAGAKPAPRIARLWPWLLGAALATLLLALPDRVR